MFCRFIVVYSCIRYQNQNHPFLFDETTKRVEKRDPVSKKSIRTTIVGFFALAFPCFHWIRVGKYLDPCSCPVKTRSGEIRASLHFSEDPEKSGSDHERSCLTISS